MQEELSDSVQQWKCPSPPSQAPNETWIFGGKHGELIRDTSKIDFATALNYELFERGQCWTSNMD